GGIAVPKRQGSHGPPQIGGLRKPITLREDGDESVRFFTGRQCPKGEKLMSSKTKQSVRNSMPAKSAMTFAVELGQVSYLAGVTTGVSPDGRLLHTIKSNLPDPSTPWTPFVDVEATAGDVGSIVDVAMRVGWDPASRRWVCHFLAVDAPGGLRHTM